MSRFKLSSVVVGCSIVAVLTVLVAVSMITGAVTARSLIRSKTSRPSTPGIKISKRTTSTGSSRPRERTHTRPSRMTRSDPSTREYPSRDASRACSNGTCPIPTDASVVSGPFSCHASPQLWDPW